MHIFRTSVNTKAEYDELFGTQTEQQDAEPKADWIVKGTSGNEVSEKEISEFGFESAKIQFQCKWENIYN